MSDPKHGGHTGPTPDVPDLCHATVSELLDLYRSRDVSPVDVLEAQIARFEEVNDRVNAVTYTHFDAARRAARESEQRRRGAVVDEVELDLGITASDISDAFAESAACRSWLDRRAAAIGRMPIEIVGSDEV